MEIVLLNLAVVLGLTVVLFWVAKSIHREDIWSIGIYSGNSPFALFPHPLTNNEPVLSANDVSDARALFVADPFLVRIDTKWFMFFEVFNSESNRGEIAYASSSDGLRWNYEHIVLKEQFHLSYPQVFRYDDSYFMIPESAEAGAVRLYQAQNFPTEWKLVSELLHGNYLDPTILHHQGYWYLFSLKDNNVLSLHSAQQPQGPWIQHPSSPIATGNCYTRPAGRILADANRLLRLSQDCRLTYGHRVYASEITTLTPNAYSERPPSSEPLLDASGSGWNAAGMHQLDSVPLSCGNRLAAVDGKLIHKRFLWRKGARALYAIFARQK